MAGGCCWCWRWRRDGADGGPGGPHSHRPDRATVLPSSYFTPRRAQLCLLPTSHAPYNMALCLPVMPLDPSSASLPQDMASVFKSINVTEAGAYKQSDKDKILEDIVAHHGSATAFDNKLKLLFLLEPLDTQAELEVGASTGPAGWG